MDTKEANIGFTNILRISLNFVSNFSKFPSYIQVSIQKARRTKSYPIKAKSNYSEAWKHQQILQIQSKNLKIQIKVSPKRERKGGSAKTHQNQINFLPRKAQKNTNRKFVPTSTEFNSTKFKCRFLYFSNKNAKKNIVSR